MATRASARSTVGAEVAVGAVAFADSRFDVARPAAPAVVVATAGGHWRERELSSRGLCAFKGGEGEAHNRCSCRLR